LGENLIEKHWLKRPYRFFLLCGGGFLQKVYTVRLLFFKSPRTSEPWKCSCTFQEHSWTAKEFSLRSEEILETRTFPWFAYSWGFKEKKSNSVEMGWFKKNPQSKKAPCSLVIEIDSRDSKAFWCILNISYHRVQKTVHNHFILFIK
jgi:hypothetical protein